MQTKKSLGRVRASKACQRCSQRKVQCDGAELGTPCTRCRVDASPQCVFPPSRRGTYARKRSMQENPVLGTRVVTAISERVADEQVLAKTSIQMPLSYEHPFSPNTNVAVSQTPERHNLPSILDESQSTDLTGDPDTTSDYAITEAGTTEGSTMSTTNTSIDKPMATNSSLASMFEDFFGTIRVPSRGDGS